MTPRFGGVSTRQGAQGQCERNQCHLGGRSRCVDPRCTAAASPAGASPVGAPPGHSRHARLGKSNMTVPARDIQEPVVRSLSATGLWLLIINGMIGAGIFGVPAEADRLAGALSPWVFAICALLQVPILLCFAQLASYFAGTGGPVLYANA